MDIPVLINLEWYLPAKTEAPNMEDETYPLMVFIGHQQLFKGVQNNHIFTQMEILNPQIKEM